MFARVRSIRRVDRALRSGMVLSKNADWQPWPRLIFTGFPFWPRGKTVAAKRGRDTVKPDSTSQNPPPSSSLVEKKATRNQPAQSRLCRVRRSSRSITNCSYVIGQVDAAKLWV